VPIRPRSVPRNGAYTRPAPPDTTVYVRVVTPCDQKEPAARLARTRSGSRRLDASRDAAIASAVVEVLGRVGYAGLTMDAVAAAAGVGKATIYRRWSSKAELLLGVLDVVGAPLREVPDTGKLREDLAAVLTEVVELLGGSSGRAVRSLLGAVADDPVLQEGCHRLPLADWDAVWETVLTRAEARGEVPAGVGRSIAAEVGPAVLVLRWLVTGRPLDGTVVLDLVDRVLLPLLQRP
jgi:AcrR family transcriptional regulator